MPVLWTNVSWENAPCLPFLSFFLTEAQLPHLLMHWIAGDLGDETYFLRKNIMAMTQGHANDCLDSHCIFCQGKAQWAENNTYRKLSKMQIRAKFTLAFL